MAKPLRILAIVNTPWDPRLGAARVWIELAKEWTQAGHLVEKFCLMDAFPAEAASPGARALQLLRFPARAGLFVRKHAGDFDVIDALIGTVPYRKGSLRFGGLLVARSVGLYRLYEKFERSRANAAETSSRARLRGRLFYSFVNRRVRAASDASVRHCDLLNLPNSDELTCVREEIGSSKPAIIQPYGLTSAGRDSLRAAAAPAEARWHEKRVCFLGMWSPRKGSRDWREIIERVRAAVPAARFLFLGTMVENRQLLNELGLGAPDFIELRPHFTPEELPQLLGACTVGAFPSYVEGFGMAVVEQLAAGLPTVAYDAPGPRDILRASLPEMLVPAGDVVRFSQAITSILQRDVANYELLSEQSAAAAERFSWTRIARETIDEYRRQLADRP